MNFNIYEIIESTPKNLSDIEKIRYIYLKCGELFAYNEEVFYASWTRAIELYDESFYWGSILNNKSQSKIKITCNQVASALEDAINITVQTLKMDGHVWAEKIGYVYSEETHVATLLHIDDKVYFLDLYKDLFRIQNGMKTCYFAPNEEKLEKEKNEHPTIKDKLTGIKCTIIPDKELIQMDKKCGYNRNGIYMDDALIQLKKEMDELKDINDLKEIIGDIKGESKEELLLNFKLEFIRRYLMNSNQESKIEINELAKFYMKIFYTLLSDKEIEEHELTSNYIFDDENNASVVFNISTKKGLIHYIYRGEKGGLKRITDEELKELNTDRSKFR